MHDHIPDRMSIARDSILEGMGNIVAAADCTVFVYLYMYFSYVLGSHPPHPQLLDREHARHSNAPRTSPPR